MSKPEKLFPRTGGTHYVVDGALVKATDIAPTAAAPSITPTPKNAATTANPKPVAAPVRGKSTR